MAMRALWLVAIAIATSGCTSLNIYPRDGDVISDARNPVPVTVRLDWPSDGRGMGPVVDVDGVNVPATQFAYSKTGATTTVYLRPGVHTVRAYSAQLCWICVGNIGQFNLTRTFLVTSTSPTMGLTLAPATVAKAGE